MTDEKEVYHKLAEKLRKNKQGIKMSSGKTIHAKRSQNCFNCLMAIKKDITIKGCWFFTTIIKNNIQRPGNNGICIPVRNKTSFSETHKQEVTTWLIEHNV